MKKVKKSVALTVARLARARCAKSAIAAGIFMREIYFVYTTLSSAILVVVRKSVWVRSATFEISPSRTRPGMDNWNTLALKLKAVHCRHFRLEFICVFG